MTDSDIYQLIGKAYCDGVSQGVEKSASMMKQALNMETMLNAADKLKESGQLQRATDLIERLKSRGFGLFNGLTENPISSALAGADKLRSTLWNQLNFRTGSDFIDGFIPSQSAIDAGRKAYKAYHGNVLKYLKSAVQNASKYFKYKDDHWSSLNKAKDVIGGLSIASKDF